MEIYNHIVKNNYYEFVVGKTPASTVSALLGDFMRNGTRELSELSKTVGTYSYYLTKNRAEYWY
jgi:hypothetical protein